MKEYKSLAKEYVLTVKESDIAFKKCKIHCSDDINKYIRQFYFDDIEIYESFFLILLNRANNITGWVKISQGGIAGTVADVKLICKYAIESLASSVIIAHNHPSGNQKPSDSDITLTRKIKEALLLIETRMLDHIILTPDNYYSMADEGII